MRWTVLVIFALLGLVGCAGPIGDRYGSYTQPPQLDDGWPVADAAAKGVDVSALERMSRGLASHGFVQLRSMLLVRDGALVFELYDRPSRARALQDLRSTTKSVTGLLVAEAAARGHLDLDAPVLPHLTPDPASFDADWQTTTWRQLLTMRSGLACNDHDAGSPGHEERMYASRDWVAFWLKVPREGPAGAQGRYCTGNAVALGRALESAVGEPVDAWAARVLFSPLGITDARWATYAGGDRVDTGGHLRLRPRDLARIGQLVLEGGSWQGAAVLSPAAVAASVAPISRLEGSDYGLLWWVSTFESVDGRALRVWETRGNGGQHLFVLPELGLVASFTGGAYNHPDAALPYALMARHVLPALGVQVSPNI
ncbi:Beta-lactamase class C [Enhygromyxa salina]|uniref:Beta-lactamase class C n=1 Tax=Enhygromyxa salina TaxID=215803 RepID=A0A0C2DIP4_9BACT|nr:serine hydrolase domain-containing protein [Enhygromyxa salina]KIG19547.1 Beta-lactamase class C [Enhygromyxa salina]